MNKVKIITDSCADLEKTMRDRFDIDYVKMNTIYHDSEQKASLDWEYYSASELYGIMRNGERVLTTQVPTTEFEEVFEKYLKQGYDIVYVSCSVKQSGSINTGTVVAKKLMEKYPQQVICCVDSFNASAGEGMVAIKAALFRDQGLSAKEIEQKVIEIRKDVNEYVTVNTLEFLRKAGRVKGSAAFFGNLLGVKPIIIADADGYQTPIKKVKGRKTSLDEIIKLLKESIIDPENQIIFIAHADCINDANYLKEQIEKNIKCKEIYINYIGPIVGSSVGPDAIGVWGFGKKVTFKAN